MKIGAAASPPVGKVVGDCVYVHKSAVEQSAVPADVVDKRAEHLPKDFNFDIIKWNRKTGDVSFLQSPDWDRSPEPLVGDSCKVEPDGDVKLRKSNPENPQIYHHKYSFVAPDYQGFNVAESKQHAQQWEALHPDKTRIGYKKYWDQEVVPKLPAAADYNAQQMEIANKTARAHGAVGGRALVPRHVEQTSSKDETILDFGSGPAALHTGYLGNRASLTSPPTSLATTFVGACTIPRRCR